MAQDVAGTVAFKIPTHVAHVVDYLNRGLITVKNNSLRVVPSHTLMLGLYLNHKLIYMNHLHQGKKHLKALQLLGNSVKGLDYGS
jgi:hypothetical protein